MIRNCERVACVSYDIDPITILFEAGDLLPCYFSGQIANDCGNSFQGDREASELRLEPKKRVKRKPKHAKKGDHDRGSELRRSARFACDRKGRQKCTRSDKQLRGFEFRACSPRKPVRIPDVTAAERILNRHREILHRAEPARQVTVADGGSGGHLVTDARELPRGAVR